MTRVTIEPGICGLATVIEISSEDMQTAALKLTSQCPGIMGMRDEIAELDAFSECFGKMEDGIVCKSAANHCKHPGCPVASGIIKGLEVECGLALPRDVKIHVEKV